MVKKGKQMDSVQDETLAVSATGKVVDNRHNRPLLFQRSRHRLTEESLRKASAQRRKPLWKERSKKACINFINGKCAASFRMSKLHV